MLSTRAILLAFVASVISVPICKPSAPNTGNTATDLAANVVEMGVEASVRDDGGPKWQELDRRLDRLFDNKTRKGDEAVVILMSFYLGEHEGEELNENLLSRGPRMIPLLERYLHEEPSSLLDRYPKRVRLERTTTLTFLKEDVEILRFQAGSRHVASTFVETGPLEEQTGACTVRLMHQPSFKFADNLAQRGESYDEAPVLRANIEESGDISNLELLSTSGIRRLDSLLLKDVSVVKYAPRPHCGLVQANIVVTIDWTPSK